MAEKINGITLKEADTNLEKMILGIISEESSRMQHGKLTIEIVVRNGKPSHVDSFQPKRGFNLNG